MKSSSMDILPQPFAWIRIPEGKVTLKSGGYLDKDTTFTVPTFEIAKYPCTNAQFKLFVDAGGYDEKRWWTDDGWAERQYNNWIPPLYSKLSMWNGADYPVVYVSWYEAVAFCLWLSETTGEKIMLPTEQQWQRAAQGDKGLMYPWGNEWNSSLCNHSVELSESYQTTPVRQYEGKGDSLFGVTDMVGNVYEWCFTAYETGKTDLNGIDVRVIRGGSWTSDDIDSLSVVFRDFITPEIRNDYWGFRIARL